MPQIVIGNNQDRVKDCYASSSIIDLTLRSNGEEKVMVMDSLGQFTVAGFEAPTVAPTTVLGSTVAPVLTASQFVAYRYVYAATSRYPYVQNETSAGGDISPRSNPSPSSTPLQTSASGNKISVTCTNSLRVDIDRIWIFRTDYYLTSAEALTAADAGLLKFVASVTNNAIPGTITYTDESPIISGNEEIEVDNFPAPEFALCLYAPPYFYGYGNQEFYAEITVTSGGLVTLVDASDKWFDGRDGETVTMDEITSGGADGYGTYYFKWLSNTTAQLCLDIELTLNGPVASTGQTWIHIKGESTTLYRSKANNPFSWGEIEVVGDVNVPQLYAQKVGGGQGTAMAIVPILNLLKLDTEGPNKTYVFNLNAESPAFEASKREISNDFSTSNHWSQFTAKGADGNSYLWFFDYKYKAICQADGAVNTSVSTSVFETLRNLSTDEDDRKFGHGVYDPGLEISCVWLTTSGSTIKNNLLVIFHHPTNQWTTVEQRDVLCSLSFLDKLNNEQITLIGTDTGRIGQAFTRDYYWDWLSPFSILNVPCVGTVMFGFSQLTTSTDIGQFNDSMIGIWCYLTYSYVNKTNSNTQMQQQDGKIVGCARISDFQGGSIVTFDKFILLPEGTEVSDLPGLMREPTEYANSAFGVFPGMILCNSCKYFPVPQIFQAEKVVEFWATLDNSYDGLSPSEFRSLSTRLLINPEYKNLFDVGSSVNEETLIYLTQGDRIQNSISVFPDVFSSTIKSNIWYTNRLFNVDKTNGFRVTLENIGYEKYILHNYQLTWDA